MSKETYRVGIIGAGWWAVAVHWPLLRDDDRVEVAAICRRNEELLAKASKTTGVTNTYTDWRNMLEREQFDAVLVCTPTHLHAEPAIAALEKNMHVLVEKPMTFSTNDANAMIAAAKVSKGNLMVGYPRRCDPLWRVVHKLIRDGAIGRIRQINAVAFDNLLLFNDPSKVPEGGRKMIENSGEIRPFLEDILKVGNWRGDPAVAGGSMFVDQHTHHIDLMLWLAGASAREVSCLLAKDGFPVERAITSHAQLDNDVLFSLSYTNGVDADQEKYFGKIDIVITGDAGGYSCCRGTAWSSWYSDRNNLRR